MLAHRMRRWAAPAMVPRSGGLLRGENTRWDSRISCPLATWHIKLYACFALWKVCLAFQAVARLVMDKGCNVLQEDAVGSRPKALSLDELKQTTLSWGNDA
jgi:hypothetical protein